MRKGLLEILLEREGIFLYNSRTIPGEHIPKRRIGNDVTTGKLLAHNNTKIRTVGVEQKVTLSTTSSTIGEFSKTGKQPRKLELKEKIFNDFFKAFVVKPQTKNMEEQKTGNEKESNEAEFANLKSVYSQSKTGFNPPPRIAPYDNFYQGNESNFWTKQMEKSMSNCKQYQDLSANVIYRIIIVIV